MNDSLLKESKAHMVAGIPLLVEGRYVEALAHFDEAVKLRRQLPWREDGDAAYLFAAACLNRSDALRGLGDPELFPNALRSLDETIEAMQYVPLAEKTIFVERLILAWINRGSLCGSMGDAEASLAGFAEAEKVLDAWGTEATATRIFQSVMLRVNRALVLLGIGRSEAGWKDARGAIAILRKLETSPDVASAGIKARSIQCHALAMLLDEPGGEEKVGDWIAEATDSTEEALALVRASGFTDEWVADLVRYGARIYQVCQPQFLGEFLTEWIGEGGPLAGNGKLKEQMRNVLLVAQIEIERKILLIPQDTEFVEKQLRILKTLQVVIS